MKKIAAVVALALVSVAGFSSTASATTTVCYDYSITVAGNTQADAACHEVPAP